MSRVKNIHVPLDQTKIANFFEDRARRFNADMPLTAVLYQDAHPEVAEQRDRMERARVTPYLALTGSERVLDIGCGIGRWASGISDKVAAYHGIDASPSLIDLARACCHHPHIAFHALGVDDLDDTWLAENGPFDRLICSGILIYLDDTQVARLLPLLARHLAPGAIAYFREPMGMSGRLTLAGHWSDELQADYSAVYRSREETTDALAAAFPTTGFTIDPHVPLFDEASLNNRAETLQHFCLIRKDR